MPIVQLGSKHQLVYWTTVGYEALLRTAPGTGYIPPLDLFRFARAEGREQSLDLWCIARTLEQLPELSGTHRIFVNVKPSTLITGAFERTIRRILSPCERRRVIFEILEGPVESYTRLRACIEKLSEKGWGFAIDDIGEGGEGLERMSRIGPVQFLKIDRSFLKPDWTRVPEGARRWLGRVCQWCAETGAAVILEGVEEPCLRLMPEICEWGVTLGQGFLFGQAAPADNWQAVVRD